MYQEQDVGGGPRDSNNKKNYEPQLKKDENKNLNCGASGRLLYYYYSWTRLPYFISSNTIQLVSCNGTSINRSKIRIETRYVNNRYRLPVS